MSTSGDDLLDRLAAGYQGSQILLTANRLGVFTAVAERPADAVELAARLGIDPRGTRILCDALVALGLLVKERGRYAGAPGIHERLVAGAPGSRVHQLRHAARQYRRWADLDRSVVTGEPAEEPMEETRSAADERDFARAMDDVGRTAAVSTAEALDLSGVSTLLDLGGGPGRYAIEFARRAAGLRVVLFDRPATLEVARENLLEAGLEDRVELRPGDAFTDDLGGPYDLVFCSNLVHIYPAEAARRLLERCAAVVAPEGRVAVKDFLLDPDRTSPPGAAIFAVNMLVSTAGGDCHTAAEVGGWLEEAGLVVESLQPVATRSRLLVARRQAPRRP